MSNSTYKYDFVIVGAGFAGATCARLLTDKGYKCLIVEERPFVSGNCVTDTKDDIDIHFFGAHILHTNNATVWNFLKLYGDIYEHQFPVLGWNNGRIYRIPYGMDLINELYGVVWPYEGESELNNDRSENNDPKTIKDYSLTFFSKEIYETVIKGFYEKLYNDKCENIPFQCMLERKEDELIYNNSFYRDKFQGVPKDGYVKLVENIIGDDIDILLNTNFLSNKEKFLSLGKYVIYTGELDKFFNYCMGHMDWIGVEFDFHNDSDKTNNLSGAPIVHFCDDKTKWYRMTEHKWLTPWRDSEPWKSNTFNTYEIYKEWKPGDETFYPRYNDRSLNLYSRYLDKLHKQYPSVLLCGRKALFNNDHICDVIEKAMKLADRFPDK